MTGAPGNDFLIQPIEVTKTQVVFDLLLLAGQAGRTVAVPPGEPISVPLTATADRTATADKQEKTIEVKLNPVADDFPLREIDFREEAQKALAPDEPSGYVVPPYQWWDEDNWPKGTAPISHIADGQVLGWDKDKPLERGAEVRIRFPELPEAVQDHVGAGAAPPRPVRRGPPPEGAAGKGGPRPSKAANLRTSTEIQGNILAGFNKDHQEFLFLRFADTRQARKWVKELIAPRRSRHCGPPDKVTMTAR